MRITIAICTWNRAYLLSNTFAQMHKMLIPHGLKWELLVVNNNCTDHTDEVIASFSAKLPIRRIFEPTPGLSNARNAAVRAATGDYIIWTDDDVLVNEFWLSAYAEAFQRWPDAAVFGGPVTPWFADTPPKWITEAWPLVASAYATRDLGPTPFKLRLSGNLIPYGANYAIRMSEQEEHLYDPRLGVRRGNLTGGEEVEVMKVLLTGGANGWWVPDAKVRHWIPKERQTLIYLIRYAAGQGRRLATLAPDKTSPRLFGRPRYLYREFLAATARYIRHRIFDTPQVWISDLLNASMCLGRLVK